MSEEERDKKMSVGVRDTKMSNIASKAAEAFCDMHSGEEYNIKTKPEYYLDYTIPYLTVRNLHFLKADSRWIKAFAIITGVLTFVLAALTIALVLYAWRLDKVIHSLQKTPPAATSSPTASPVTH
jgi:hypothetical protein